MRGGFCNNSELGKFIIKLPNGTSMNDTSFWSARLEFSQGNTSESTGSEVSIGGFWNNPAGNPTPPDSNYSSPWRRDTHHYARQSGASLNPSPSAILTYKEPIQYLVRKTGYYCVGALFV